MQTENEEELNLTYSGIHQGWLHRKNDYFIFLENEQFSERAGKNKGWKLHISVKYEDVARSFDLIAPVLYKNFFKFKVIQGASAPPHFFAVSVPPRLFKGAQFTIALTEDENDKPDVEILPIIEEITQILQENNIDPGICPDSDAPLKDSPYFSIRNSCLFGGEETEGSRSYLSAEEINNQFNPANRVNPYIDLLSKTVQLSHDRYNFDKLIDNIEEIGTSIRCIVFSFLHKYLNLNLIDEEKIQDLVVTLACKNNLEPYEYLWRENASSDEALKKMQDVARLILFIARAPWDDNYVLSSNKYLDLEIQSILEFLDKKLEKNAARTENAMQFDRFYIESPVLLSLEQAKENEGFFDSLPADEQRNIMTLILNACKAFPLYQQQAKELNYETTKVSKQVYQDIIYVFVKYLPPYAENNAAIIQEILKLSAENNPFMKTVAFGLYFGTIPSPNFPISLEKSVALSHELSHCGIAEIEEEMNDFFQLLLDRNLMDEKGNLLPHKISKDNEARFRFKPLKVQAASPEFFTAPDFSIFPKESEPPESKKVSTSSTPGSKK